MREFSLPRPVLYLVVKVCGDKEKEEEEISGKRICFVAIDKSGVADCVLQLGGKGRQREEAAASGLRSSFVPIRGGGGGDGDSESNGHDDVIIEAESEVSVNNPDTFTVSPTKQQREEVVVAMPAFAKEVFAVNTENGHDAAVGGLEREKEDLVSMRLNMASLKLQVTGLKMADKSMRGDTLELKQELCQVVKALKQEFGEVKALLLDQQQQQKKRDRDVTSAKESVDNLAVMFRGLAKDQHDLMKSVNEKIGGLGEAQKSLGEELKAAMTDSLCGFLRKLSDM